MQRGNEMCVCISLLYTQTALVTNTNSNVKPIYIFT